MQYHDKENLSVLETPKSELPWYHKLWTYPLAWAIDKVVG